MLAGFTEEQAASGIGVDEATVREWCEGHADPPKEVVDALERLVATQRA
jgi:ParB-like chromosome segregation protein Spo0J